jgi:hypothetical protein
MIMPLKTYFNLHDKGVSVMFEEIIVTYNGMVEVIGSIGCFLIENKFSKFRKYWCSKTVVQQEAK